MHRIVKKDYSLYIGTNHCPVERFFALHLAHRQTEKLMGKNFISCTSVVGLALGCFMSKITHQGRHSTYVHKEAYDQFLKNKQRNF